MNDVRARDAFVNALDPVVQKLLLELPKKVDLGTLAQLVGGLIF
jgi:hypothetical protein